MSDRTARTLGQAAEHLSQGAALLDAVAARMIEFDPRASGGLAATIQIRARVIEGAVADVERWALEEAE